MSLIKKRRVNVIKVYKQIEWIYTNGIRRVVPIFVRPIDKKSFGKTKTEFTEETKNRVETEKRAKLMAYIPVRSAEPSHNCLQEVIDMNFNLKPVMDFFRPIRRRMTMNEWYRREDCFKYVLCSGVGRDTSPRSSRLYIDSSKVWLLDHNYFRTDANTEFDLNLKNKQKNRGKEKISESKISIE